MDLRYSNKFLMRCRTAASLLCSSYLKIGPHTGISDEPCAENLKPKRRTFVTYSSGNVPPCRFARVVRSGGAFRRERAYRSMAFPLRAVASRTVVFVRLPAGRGIDGR